MAQAKGWKTNACSLLVGAIILCPFATFGLSFRGALVAQALMVTCLTLAIGIIGILPTARVPHFHDVPYAARVVACLWGLAGAQGFLVGLSHGNDLELVAGQALAIGLLTFGIIVAAGWKPLRLWRGLVDGLLIGTLTGIAISSAPWLSGVVTDQQRAFYFPNHASVSGVFLLSVMLCLNELSEARGNRRFLLSIMLLVFGLYLVALGSRSLLVLVPLCVALWGWLAGQPRLVVRTAVVSLTVVLAVSSVAVLLLSARGTPVLPNTPVRLEVVSGNSVPEVIEFTPPSDPIAFISFPGEDLVLVSPILPVDNSGSFRIEADILGHGMGTAYVGVRWRTSDSRLLRIDRGFAPARGTWQEIDKVVASPKGASKLQLTIGTKDAAWGEWWIRSSQIYHLGPSLIANLARQRAFLSDRYGRSTRWVLDPVEQPPSSVSFRIDEAKVVGQEFVEAPLIDKLLGHGLGATFSFKLPTFKDATPGSNKQQNYVHNLYLFLPFKLGVVGSALILTAAGVYLSKMLRKSVSMPPSIARGRVAAIAAAWIGYLVWALVAPELIDFRIAPLWGIAIAAASGKHT